jgi:hypothetical protein
MRKALLPMIASLALCGAATAALIATNARAEQGGRKPVMLALVGQGALSGADTAARAPEDGPAPDMVKDDGSHRAQFCKDMYARKVGEMAFLEAKLTLASQQPLFDHWKQASLDIAKAHEGDCTGHETAHKPGQRPSVLDQMSLEETMLKKRLADIDAEKPSLTAFYNSLSSQQKQEFGHADMHRMVEHVHMMMGMMGAPHPDMGGHTMVIHSPAPMPGPMGDAPAPPAQ